MAKAVAAPMPISTFEVVDSGSGGVAGSGGGARVTSNVTSFAAATVAESEFMPSSTLSCAPAKYASVRFATEKLNATSHSPTSNPAHAPRTGARAAPLRCDRPRKQTGRT